MTIFNKISQLITKGIDAELIEPRDTIYVRNQILGLLKLDNFEETTENSTTDSTIPDILEEIIAYAIEANGENECGVR